MRLNRSFLSAILVFLLAAPLTVSFCGQEVRDGWVPVVAKKAQRFYKLSSGGTTLLSEELGIFLRNSDGSTYTRAIPVGGTATTWNAEATLEDARDGKTYAIDYQHRRATVIQRPEPGTVLPLNPPTGEDYQARSPDLSLGSKIIGGVECVGWKVVERGPHNPGGEIWVAPSLSYLIVESKIVDKGHDAFIDMVLEDIHGGKEPDPQFFHIPEGFKVVE
jgi:hypothetical protein